MSRGVLRKAAPVPVAPLPPERDSRTRTSLRRWSLMRDALVFQAKMLLEGVRDVLLVPLTLAAALFGLLFGGERPERQFQRVLRAGDRFDAWLNLFRPLHSAEGRELDQPHGSIDEYFGAVEEAIVRQHDRGGLTESTRRRIDAWLDKLQDRTGTGPSRRTRG